MSNKIKFLLISLVALGGAAAFSSCTLADIDGVEIDSGAVLSGGNAMCFSLGEEVDEVAALSSCGLSVVNPDGKSYSVTKAMLESDYYRLGKIDTSSVGAGTVKLTFNYNDYYIDYAVYSFTVNFIMPDGTIYKSVNPSVKNGKATINLSDEYNYALDADVISSDEEKALSFSGWTDENGNAVTGEYVLTPDENYIAEVNFYADFLTDEERSAYNLYYENGEKVFGGLTASSACSDYAVKIPESVTLVDLYAAIPTLGAAAELYIPSTAGVNYSCAYAPYEKCSLTAVYVDEDNAELSSYGGGLYTKDYSTLIYFPCAAESFTLHPLTARINGGAFSCSQLTEIDLTGADYVGEYCFAYSSVAYVSVSSAADVSARAYLLSELCGHIEQYGDDGKLIASYYVYYENNVPYYCLGYVDSKATELTLMQGTAEIAPYALSGCSALTKVTLNEGLEYIGEYAFAYCTALTSIELPSSLTTAGEGAFMGCSSLSEINEIPSIDYLSADRLDPNALPDYFLSGTALTSVTLSEGFVSLGKNSLSDMTALTSVKLPASLETVGYRAFAGDEALSKVSVTKGSALERLSEECFYSCSSLSYFPFDNLKNFKTISPRAFALSGLSRITFSPSYENIDDYAFEGCVALESVSLDGITDIGNYSFKDCTALVNIDFGTVVDIYEGAFEGCTALKDVTFTDTVYIVESYAFRNCTALESVYFGNTVGRFGEYAFDKKGNVTVAESAVVGCTSLKEINVHTENLTFSSEYGILYTIDRDTLYILPAAYEGEPEIEPSVRYIYPYAISGYSVKNLVIPDGVENVYKYAIYGIEELESIYIPYSAVRLYVGFYTDCPNVKTITIDEDNEYYYNDARGNVYYTCPYYEKDVDMLLRKDTLAFDLS